LPKKIDDLRFSLIARIPEESVYRTHYKFIEYEVAFWTLFMGLATVLKNLDHVFGKSTVEH